jgi:uncharacterized membrane protein SpoIIM required for sporulation
MQEVAFLKQNTEKWKQIEAILSGKNINPDTLAELFIQLTDDLSFAKTFYPGSKTVLYLNSLAAKVHQAVYRNKKEKKSRLITFWKFELPAILKDCRREMFYSLIIFILSLFIGIVSSANDKTFVRLILGDTYVNMTLENIDKGDPLAVYKKVNEIDMFFGITFNNIRVALYAFTAGVLFSFGTGLLLFYNGVMLGAFHYFFFQKGMLISSMLTIWIHGTLEISAIIIAGCAGLVMGNSILFPGSYTRRRSFMNGAKNGLKIVIGLIPVFILAGFLEGFVTRHTGMPAFVSLCIIISSLIFIIWYFIIYPLNVKKEAAHANS